MSQTTQQPLISIGLPTRDSMQYLEPRISSILNQSYQNWELIVVDGESKDGTWERLSELAKSDPRVRMESRQPDGIYPAFNRCVELAKGDFVYIATSDDTMAEDCLEKLAKALIENPDCDIAHCPQRVLNADGSDGADWWSANSIFVRSAPELANRKHKRMAPHDGLVCILGENIYNSVTQFLIRRSLYDQVGYYSKEFGSIGDFHWNLRAALAASCVHVPDTWGGWRMHEQQVTAQVGFYSEEFYNRIDRMIQDAVDNSDNYLKPETAKLVKGLENGRSKQTRLFLRKFKAEMSKSERQKACLKELFAGNRAAASYYLSRISGGPKWPQGAPASVRTWIPGDSIQPLD